MAALLYQMQPRRPVTFVAVPLVLSLVALLASVIPALRAMRVDPITALRTKRSNASQSAIRNYPVPVPVHVLGFHAGYRCRHAGVCCTSGWTIPVEAPLYRTLQSRVAWGHLRLDDGSRAPELVRARRRAAAWRARSAARHNRRLVCFLRAAARQPLRDPAADGARPLPSACRHFPRVVVLDPRGTFITLSHVCPTAARMLIAGGPADVVTDAIGFDEHAVWEGLDARDALPPLLRPACCGTGRRGILGAGDSRPSRCLTPPEQRRSHLETSVRLIAELAPRWRAAAGTWSARPSTRAEPQRYGSGVLATARARSAGP